MYSEKFEKDLNFGLSNELKLKPLIEEHLNIDLELTKQKHNFDYVNEENKIYIELKSRRCCKKTYPFLYFSINKFYFIQNNPDYKYYIVYKLIDGVYIFKYNKSHIFFRYGGRVDRGKNEIKKLVCVPTKFLEKINVC